MTYIISAVTDKGNFKKINQDSFYIKSTNVNKKPIVFCIVCDGLGGLSSGEFASSIVVQSFIRWFGNFLKREKIVEIDFEEVCQNWKLVIQECNQKLIKFGDRRNIQMGTTLNAVIIVKNRYLIANIGDSRTYSFIKRVKRITKDHSIVEQEVDNGNLSHEEVKTDSRRHLLTKCIGVIANVEADFYYGRLKGNQMLISCSDGFYKEIDEKEMAKIFEKEMKAGESGLNNAVTTITELVKSRGEKDNITVLAIKREKKRFL